MSTGTRGKARTMHLNDHTKGEKERDIEEG